MGGKKEGQRRASRARARRRAKAPREGKEKPSPLQPEMDDLDRELRSPQGTAADSAGRWPAHSSNRSLRQAAVLQMQRERGNAQVVKTLGKIARQPDQPEGTRITIEEPRVYHFDQARALRGNKNQARNPPFGPGWPYRDELRSLWQQRLYNQFANWVADFQWKEMHLPVEEIDGIVGPQTAMALRFHARAYNLNKRYAGRLRGWPYDDDLRRLWQGGRHNEFADQVKEYQIMEMHLPENWAGRGHPFADGILGEGTAAALQRNPRRAAPEAEQAAEPATVHELEQRMAEQERRLQELREGLAPPSQSVEDLTYLEKWAIVLASSGDGFVRGLTIALFFVLTIALAISVLAAFFPELVAVVEVALATAAGQWFVAAIAALGISAALNEIINAFFEANQAVHYAVTVHELREAGNQLGFRVGNAILDLIPILVGAAQRFARRMYNLRPARLVRAPAESGGGTPTAGGRRPSAGARPTPFRIPGLRRRVTLADLMAWERQGGHALAKHGPHHTRQTLLQRILGEDPSLQPQTLPGGMQPTDFRIWRGERRGAASRWIDQETMQDVIGEALNQHPHSLEAVARGEVPEMMIGFDANRIVGEGWITTAGVPGSQRAVFWKPDLQRATIVIRPDGRGGWYVHTAYPSH